MNYQISDEDYYHEVNGYTEDELNQFESFQNVISKYPDNKEDIIQAINDFVKAHYIITEAIELAECSMILINAAKM